MSSPANHSSDARELRKSGVGLTAKQRKALELLLDGPLLPEEFYVRMWPGGKHVNQDHGSMGGGPSRAQCAANWFLGRMGELVRRDGYLAQTRNAGKWMIAKAGRAALGRVS